MNAVRKHAGVIALAALFLFQGIGAPTLDAWAKAKYIKAQRQHLAAQNKRLFLSMPPDDAEMLVPVASIASAK